MRKIDISVADTIYRKVTEVKHSYLEIDEDADTISYYVKLNGVFNEGYVPDTGEMEFTESEDCLKISSITGILFDYNTPSDLYLIKIVSLGYDVSINVKTRKEARMIFNVLKPLISKKP